MFRTAAAALVLALLVCAAPVQAAELELSAAAAGAIAGALDLASDTDWSLSPVHIGSADHKISRGALLPSLYVSLAALNFYDGYSTKTGLAHGAVESNGALRGVVGNSAALIAVKSGTTALSIFMAERLWKKGHKAQAIAVMVVSNGMMSAVAAHNASILRQVR